MRLFSLVSACVSNSSHVSTFSFRNDTNTRCLLRTTASFSDRSDWPELIAYCDVSPRRRGGSCWSKVKGPRCWEEHLRGQRDHRSAAAAAAVPPHPHPHLQLHEISVCYMKTEERFVASRLKSCRSLAVWRRFVLLLYSCFLFWVRFSQNANCSRNHRVKFIQCGLMF